MWKSWELLLFFHATHSATDIKLNFKKTKKNLGDAGHRFPYLSHAKRALYHLSYIPLIRVLVRGKLFNSRSVGFRSGGMERTFR